MIRCVKLWIFAENNYFNSTAIRPKSTESDILKTLSDITFPLFNF